MKKIALGVVFAFNFLFANYLTNINFNNSNALEIYKTAIYDTYLQLNKFIEEGVDTHRLKQFDGKIVVGIMTDNLPINEILYLSVIGTKNFFQVKTAYDENTKRGFLIFSAYDREADANYSLNKLRKLGIKAVKVYNGKWYNNPVVVNSIIIQLKNTALANFPVKVIVKEKYILIPKEKYIVVPKYKEKVIYKTPKKIKKTSFVKEEKKEKIAKLITLITHLKKEAIPIVKDELIGLKWKGKFYTKGSKIGEFTITETKKSFYIYKCRKYLKVAFKFDDFDKYHLVFRIPLKTKLPNCVIESDLNIKQRSKPKSNSKSKKIDTTCNEDAKPIITQILSNKNQNTSKTITKNKKVEVEDTKKTESKDKIKDKKSVNNFYKCDFKQIKVLHTLNNNGELQRIHISHTPYNFGKTSEVIKLKEENNYIYFKKNGLPVMAISKRAWNKRCYKE